MATLIFGAGSIGCLIGGLLAAAGEPVTLLGRAYNLDPMRRQGLQVKLLGQPALTLGPDRLQFTDNPDVVGTHDRILVTVKGAATAEVAETLASRLGPDSIVISFQNGVHNAAWLRQRLKQRVLAGMVPFNVVQDAPGQFRQTTAGHLYLEQEGDDAPRFAARLAGVGMPVALRHDMPVVLWSKLVLNLNNAVNALSGIPLRTMLLDADYRRVLAAAQSEALGLMRQAGLPTCRLGLLWPPALPWLLRLPTPLFQRVARAALALDPQASSSMQDDLRAGRRTEIDLLNGEIVALAERLGQRAPVNQRLCALVRDAEARQTGSPMLPGQALWSLVGAASAH